MCKKLREIHGLVPLDIMKKCYADFAITPVNMESVLTSLGIAFKQYDFSSLEANLTLKKNEHILGLAYSQEDDLRILFSSDLTDSEANFVLAHELGHCCLHLPVTAEFHVEMFRAQDIYSPLGIFMQTRRALKKKEEEATKFAADLLIPTHILQQFILSHDVSDADMLLKEFNVPIFLLIKKLEMLKRAVRMGGDKECQP